MERRPLNGPTTHLRTPEKWACGPRPTASHYSMTSPTMAAETAPRRSGMKRIYPIVLLGCALLTAQALETDSLVAASIRGDGAVNLYRAQGARLSLIKTVPVGKRTGEMCLDPQGTRIFVT